MGIVNSEWEPRGSFSFGQGRLFVYFPKPLQIMPNNVVPKWVLYVLLLEHPGDVTMTIY